MCVFSGSVERVADTRIFARHRAGRQVLVYEMTYAASSDLAMVLPLPVPQPAADDAVRFIALDGYPRFFRRAVPPSTTSSIARRIRAWPAISVPGRRRPARPRRSSIARARPGSWMALSRAGACG